METSQDSKHKDLIAALQILENYQPIFFPVRAERLTPIWARQQALRLKRLPKEVVFLLSTSGSVSYTHLDVYKRQVLAGSITDEEPSA